MIRNDDKEFHEEKVVCWTPASSLLSSHDPVFPTLHESVRGAAVQVFFIGHANIVFIRQYVASKVSVYNYSYFSSETANLSTSPNTIVAVKSLKQKEMFVFYQNRMFSGFGVLCLVWGFFKYLHKNEVLIGN